jgi:hypothetical protein
MSLALHPAVLAPYLWGQALRQVMHSTQLRLSVSCAGWLYTGHPSVSWPSPSAGPPCKGQQSRSRHVSHTHNTAAVAALFVAVNMLDTCLMRAERWRVLLGNVVDNSWQQTVLSLDVFR